GESATSEAPSARSCGQTACRASTAPRARPRARKSNRPTTATSSRSATILSSSSTSTATASPPNSGRATSTVRPGGTRYSPIIDGYRTQGHPVVLRADAAFATPADCEELEPRGVRYAIRLPGNDVLDRVLGHLRTRSRL